MGFARSLLFRALLCAMFVAALSGTVFADSAHERAQVGHDIYVGPDEEVTEVTCMGCNVRIRGKVQGDVTTFGGNIAVEDQGEVSGDTTAIGGSVRLDKGASVNEVTVFGGRLRRDPSATVNGDVTALSGAVWLLLIFGLPLVLLGAFIGLIVWLVRRLIRPRVPITA